MLTQFVLEKIVTKRTDDVAVAFTFSQEALVIFVCSYCIDGKNIIGKIYIQPYVCILLDTVILSACQVTK